MRLNRNTTLLVLRAAVAAVLVVGAVRTTLFTVYRVAGTSMLDTLLHGDRILVCDVPWLLGPVSAGDAVVLTVEGEILVKRVVAGPGDTLELQTGQVIRNGQPVEENIPPYYSKGDNLPPYELAEDEYFVMGDNRRVSVDSREFGPVKGEQLLGHVVLRMAPGEVSTVAALGR